MLPKLYIVTRSDLPPGAQACQGMHAMREFAARFPEEEKEWYENSNTLAFLSAKNERHLFYYLGLARTQGIRHAEFQEPDFDNELTAIAFEPTERSSEFLKELPTALKKKGLFRMRTR